MASITRQSLRFIGLITCFQAVSLAQPNRIPGPIDDTVRFTLTGNLPPLAQSIFDQGPVEPTFTLSRVTLVLKPSETQATELDGYLTELQDPKSSNYHSWLTPESYADRFGLSQADIANIRDWLTAHQLTVTGVARARNAITFSGTVEHVANAFQTEIHTFLIGDQTHYANAIAPSLPSALQGIVQAIHGLDDFRPHPQNRMLQMPLAWHPGARPNYTSPSNGNHYLAPDDFATIFDIKPLYSFGIDGSNQRVVIVGQTRIDTSHLSMFRNTFGLGEGQLTTILVPNTKDPGTRQADAQESDLDLEWVSAIARNAALLFVYSNDVMDAVEYAIDQNLAPVISMSYGECETSSSKSDGQMMQSWARQAIAQGITWVASSGDSGAAGCYQSSLGPLGPGNSDLTLAVDMPASVPEVTAIGGTTFKEGSGTYWDTTNDSNTNASAQSYIPETSWNDSTTNNLASSGGGVSQFFRKPSWQTGQGVPSDGARDVPDIAFPASADHDGYIVYTSSGSKAGWYVIGGTSAGAPSFSGVLALLNQYLVTNGYQASPGLGNINTRLYGLAASSSWVFHDITTGDNIVTATVCSGFLCGYPTTKSVGYSAGSAYDCVTGLGSLDVFNFFSVWPN
jgi:subtilase family serine protease